jgi:hypothetical protein
MTVAPPYVVHQDVLLDDLSEAAYHADPVPGGSLSSSGCKTLLRSPARYIWEQTNPQPYKAAFDFGSAAHKRVLGVGAEVRYGPFKDWRTKAAQEFQAAARADGAIPLLADQEGVIEGMAEALKVHPVAGPLLASKNGRPEVSAFWKDPWWDVWRRARFDWLDWDVVDYKTAASADPDVLPKKIVDFGYHLAAAWYLDAAQHFGPHDAEPTYTWIFQEKEAPYEVVVAQPDDEVLAAGERARDRALRLYTDCRKTGIWPGYADKTLTVGLPGWYRD